MRLQFAPNSPYVRKVLIVAHEVGLEPRIERVSAMPHPIDRDQNVVSLNPLGKIPVLTFDDGSSIYDSRVISEYLIDLSGDLSLLSASGKERWDALTQQALADGLMEASQVLRYELAARDESLRWHGWIKGHEAKIHSALHEIETLVGRLNWTIGAISIACALGYLDLRLQHIDWRTEHPRTSQWFARVSERHSVKSTVPPG